MGTIYKTKDTELRWLVALKHLPDHIAQAPHNLPIRLHLQAPLFPACGTTP